MSELAPRIAHRRMMKVKIQARDADSSAMTSTTTTATMASAQVTVTASATSFPVVSPMSTSIAAIAGVGAFLALIVIVVAGGCFWRRRKLRAHKSKAPSTSVTFNRNAFAAEKKSYGMQEHIRADLTSIRIQSPTESHKTPITPSESESSTYAGWKPQAPPNFRVTNDNAERDTYLPALPKAVAEKHRPSQRMKPSWISTDLEDMATSPPPSYDLANGSPGFVFPPPSRISTQKAVATPTPPTPPANRKLQSPNKQATASQILVVPQDEYSPVPSPARSESFAPKDLVIPISPPVAASSAALTPPSSSSSNSQGFGHSSGKILRMMTVIAPYTPTLPDELRVTVGDTVRLLQEYKDGWCFAQHVGKADAPKGVVPLVCLQERKRMVPSIGHKASNGSNTSLTSLNGWR